MAPKSEEIQKILDQFEESHAEHSIAKGELAGCVVCKHADRKTINKEILEKYLTPSCIGTRYGFHNTQIIHHKVTCLPKFGGATITALGRFDAQRQKLFPLKSGEAAQRRWYLEELQFLRDEALAKQPIDRKELAKLAKDILAAADALREAMNAVRERNRLKKSQPKESDIDDEFSPEQKLEMQKITGGGPNGRPGTAA